MEITREEELYWLALCLTPGLGARRAGALLRHFRSPQLVFRASSEELQGAGLPQGIAQSVVSGCAFEDAADQQQRMLASGAELLTLHDPRYPRQLASIYDAPVALFARGNLALLKTHMLAMVGTRRPTPYGVAATERLAADLAHAGLTIVSGLARGIDTAAHRATLEAGGGTVAVLGCGVDIVYPTENRRLAAEVVARGLVLSEFPMGTPGYPQNFPVRNRIVSGLSVGVLIVEGAQYSGSAITARLALDQCREVFAVPGNITSKMSWGPNLLIKQGAKLVQEWHDVTVELPAEVRCQLADACRKRLEAEQLPLTDATDSPDAASIEEPPQKALGREILNQLKPDVPLHIDTLMESLERYSSSELIAALFELELNGVVKQLPGKHFVSAWQSC